MLVILRRCNSSPICVVGMRERERKKRKMRRKRTTEKVVKGRRVSDAKKKGAEASGIEKDKERERDRKYKRKGKEDKKREKERIRGSHSSVPVATPIR